MQNQARKIEETFLEFNEPGLTDIQLFDAEIQVNYAHCEALFHAGILTRIESERIKNGLQTIVKRAGYDKNYFSELGASDIHSFVVARLVQLVGEAGRKIRIGRSELEHKTTTVRLWLRGEIEEISILIKKLQSELITAGEIQTNVVFPINTGFNKKQIVLWAHWCLARFETLERDKERLEEVWRRVNVSPFGAETSFEIDREEIAAALKFEGVSANSLDTLSDTDFAVEFCSACSLLALHLARITEEIIIYLSKESGLLEFKDKNSFVQEQNLNYLNLARSKSSRITSYQLTLLSANKNFALVSGKNFPEEMKILFDAVETIEICLKATVSGFKDIAVNEAQALKTAIENHSGSVEAMDYLLKKDVSFETATETVNKILDYTKAKNKRIIELNLEELQNFSPKFEEDIYRILKIEETLTGKNQIGGTAPERVFEALESARKSLEREEI